MRFKDLRPNDTFDWIDDAHPDRNSFFKRCIKTGPRHYTDSDNTGHRVGSVLVSVHHVKREQE